MINRNIINRDITYDGHGYDEICSRINRWKSLLLSHGAKRGDVVALAIMSVNINHVAAVFACAELGCQLFIFSRPLSRETIHATKMGQFGPMDFTIIEEFLWDEDYHREMFEQYGGKIIWQKEIDDVEDKGNVYGEVVRPFDPFLFVSTSGSTGKSKAIKLTHEEVLQTSIRAAVVFDFEKDSVVMHTTNMHHASAMLSHLLPSLIASDTHYHSMVSERVIEGVVTLTPTRFISFILEKGVTHCLVAMAGMIRYYVHLLNQHDLTDMVPLKINVSGFTMPEEFYNYAKKYPIEFYSHYGSVDATLGSPIFLNKVDKNSNYRPKLLGKQIDDFFKPKIVEKSLFVTSPMWTGQREMSDLLDFDGEFYYHMGRSDWTEEYVKWNDEINDLIKEQHGDYVLLRTEKATYLVLWDAEHEFNFETNLTPIKSLVKHIVYLKKTDFQVDTKVDMAQLSAYLDFNYEKV